MDKSLPALGICGWSGSGKTTLLERVLSLPLVRGLRIAVLKHDVHGIEARSPAKDSERLFRAGADVLLCGPGERLSCGRDEHGPAAQVEAASEIVRLARRYDLVLVEGFKWLATPKLWLLGPAEEAPPAEVAGIEAVLASNDDRLAAAAAVVERFLERRRRETPLCGCLLVGGQSRRMGSPKHLLAAADGRTWAERTVDVLRPHVAEVVVAGRGTLPGALADVKRLADVPDAQGPIAGLLAAMRWSPSAAWLVAGCDYPSLTTEAVEWLIAQRATGRWAIVPRQADGSPEPLLACYEPQAKAAVERLAAAGEGLCRLADDARIASPAIPDSLAAAWRDVDRPDDAIFT